MRERTQFLYYASRIGGFYPIDPFRAQAVEVDRLKE